MKELIQEFDEITQLYRDRRTGIAWVEDGHTGSGHSCHPNIDATGSIKGMKKLGYWRKDARCIRSHGFIYNVDSHVVTDKWDEIAADACECVGCTTVKGGLKRREKG